MNVARLGEVVPFDLDVSISHDLEVLTLDHSQRLFTLLRRVLTGMFAHQASVVVQPTFRG